MMKRLLLLLLSLLAAPALAGSPVIWFGANSKDLTTSGLITQAISLPNGGFTAKLQAPALTGNVTLTLPTGTGTSGQLLQTDGAGNMSWSTPTTPSPTAQSYGPSAVTAVGTAGFPQLGHVLDSKDFTALTSTQFTFYNLAANPNDGGPQGKNLTPNGTPTYTTTNILGTTNAAATLNGTNQYYRNSTDAFFDPGNVNFGGGGWYNISNWRTVAGSIFSNDNANGSDDGWYVYLPGDGTIKVAGSTASTTQSTAVFALPSSYTGWHHVWYQYASATTTFTLYLDGKQALQLVLSAAQRSPGTSVFSIGAAESTAANFLAASVEDFSFVNGYAMTADDIRKLAARRFDHNKNIATSNQLWTANWGRSDSTVATQLDASWLVSKSSTSLWADFSGVATGAFVDFSMQNVGQYGTALVPNYTYDSGVLSATPSTTIAHGLGARPVNIVYQYETTTGHFTPLQGSNFCEADATNLYCDWTGLSVSASNRLEIIAGGVPVLSAVPQASTTTNGMITFKAPTQTIYTTGSGTYTVPAGTVWLRVRMVGGGGGGSGSGTAGGSAAGAGGDSTFGSLLTASGGSAGAFGGAGGTGGAVTVNAGASGLSIRGANGGSCSYIPGGGGTGSPVLAGSFGGGSAFGGAGRGGQTGGGSAAETNSGSGGGGGGGNNAAGHNSGSGGGAGGFIDAVITAPASSYSYAVGASGTAGGAGTAGASGGSGGVGIIIIEEHYY